jgi:hypothetical protein
MNFHAEILSPTQRRVLGRLGPALTARSFYLGGGTALALRLGHRRSVDFDWFTAQRVDDPLRLAASLRNEGLPLHTGQVAPGTWHGTLSGVRISLFEYRYPLLRSAAFWGQYGCRLASRADLAAMKLAAIGQRGSKKDFVDVYALGTRRISLRQMLRWYADKYAVTDTAHLVYSLAYFDEADLERMPPMLWAVNWQTIKGTFHQWLQTARYND